MDIVVPIHQELRYIPGVLETLKFAWIQYLAFLIPSLLIFWVVIGFILRYQLVETSVTSDLVIRRKV
jgi:hypothetical protein